MSQKLEDVLVHDEDCMTNRTDLFKDCNCVCKGEHRAIKALMLGLVDESVHEAFSGSQAIETLKEKVNNL